MRISDCANLTTRLLRFDVIKLPKTRPITPPETRKAQTVALRAPRAKPVYATQKVNVGSIVGSRTIARKHFDLTR